MCFTLVAGRRKKKKQLPPLTNCINQVLQLSEALNWLGQTPGCWSRPPERSLILPFTQLTAGAPKLIQQVCSGKFSLYRSQRENQQGAGSSSLKTPEEPARKAFMAPTSFLLNTEHLNYPSLMEVTFSCSVKKPTKYTIYTK